LNEHQTERLKLSENTKNKESLTKMERNDTYSCMCVKLNELFRTRSIPKFCLNSLIGSPIYIQFISTVVFLGLIVTIATLYVLSIPVAQINNSYFANCSSNSDCNSSKGLQCSAQDGICSCPAYKTKGRCDCSKGYYWNGYECRRLYQYLETGCNADWMCDSYKTKYIYCINRTCKCESYKIFDTTAQKCKYNYLGCFYDGSFSTISYFSYAVNMPLIYFLDFCVTGCRLKGFNYTTMFKSINSLCNCVAAVNFANPRPSDCDTTCLGKDGERYSCGNTNDWRIRSVYSNFG
jgi:hypothetical protein